MQLRSGKGVSRSLEEKQPDAVLEKPSLKRSTNVVPINHPDDIMDIILVKEDFDSVMQMVRYRIKEVAQLKQEAYGLKKVEPIVMDQLRLLTEVYYLLNYNYNTIMLYIKKVNPTYGSGIILAAIDRINIVYAELMRFDFIEKYKFVHAIDQLYAEWDDCLNLYEPLYL
jgi:hypothetical protein